MEKNLSPSIGRIFSDAEKIEPRTLDIVAYQNILRQQGHDPDQFWYILKANLSPDLKDSSGNPVTTLDVLFCHHDRKLADLYYERIYGHQYPTITRYYPILK